MKIPKIIKLLTMFLEVIQILFSLDKFAAHNIDCAAKLNLLPMALTAHCSEWCQHMHC